MDHDLRNCMNILALDYGAKRIGLAWAQEGIDVVLPFGQISNVKFLISKLVDLIKKEKIGRLVVGLPLGLDGQENANTKNIRVFVQELKKQLDMPIELVDERFTTAEANRMENEGVSKDERAAMIILQTYLDKKRV